MGIICCCKNKKTEKKEYLLGDDRTSDRNITTISDFVRDYTSRSMIDEHYESSDNKRKKKISREDFTEIKLLGKGSYGKVLLVRKKENDKLFAMKILDKNLVKIHHQEDHTKTERKLLEKIDHPFIVSLHYAFQSSQKLYLVTEFMQGGELFYHLRRERYFPEEKVKFYTCEIIIALEYLHKHNCIYRDLKPENILLGKDGHIKITDFGLSKYFFSKTNDQKAFTICGTAEYLAPEILLYKGYGKSVDWWSLGVLVYEMLAGFSPYKSDKKEATEYENYIKKLDLNSFFYWSKEVRSLIEGLLTVDPTQRLGMNGATDIKNHPFFNDIVWDDVYNKVLIPPFVPIIKNEEDLSNFDKMFTEENINEHIDHNKSGNNAFKYDGFTYIKPNSLLIGDASKN